MRGISSKIVNEKYDFEKCNTIIENQIYHFLRDICRSKFKFICKSCYFFNTSVDYTSMAANDSYFPA